MRAPNHHMPAVWLSIACSTADLMLTVLLQMPSCSDDSPVASILGVCEREHGHRVVSPAIGCRLTLLVAHTC